MDLLKSRKKLIILAAIILIALIAGVSYFILSSKSPQKAPPPTEDPSKTWELILSYNNKLNVLSLKKLSLLDRAIRPDSRGAENSPYELAVLDKGKNILYKTKINIIEQPIFSIIDSPNLPKNAQLPRIPDELDTVVYAPFYKDATKIEISKNGAALMNISVTSRQSFNFISEVSAVDANSCLPPLQTVFISDNFTNLGQYHSIVEELKDLYNNTAPYNSVGSNFFDFKIIDNTEPLGCEKGIISCIENLRIKAIGQATYPKANKFIVIVNSPNAASVDTVAAGLASGVGGDIAIFTNRPDVSPEGMKETAVHEFLGHAVGELYDRYVWNTSNEYRAILPTNKSNCTTSASGDPLWNSAGASGGHNACMKEAWFAPYPKNCPSTNTSLLTSGGYSSSVMSSGSCSRGPTFDPVEENWIRTKIIPRYQQNCSNPPPPQGDCKIADAYWKSSLAACTNPSLEVITEDNCNGKSLTFSIEEDDGTLGPSPEDDPVNISYLPPNEPIEVDNSTDATWNPEIPFRADETSDPINNIVYEYYFTASIIGETTSFTSTLSPNTAGKLIAIDPSQLAACHTPLPTASPSPTPTPSPSPKTPSPTPKPIKTYTCVEVTTPLQPGRQIQLTMLECSIKN